MTDPAIRMTEHPIHEVFVRRWSPRAFDSTPLEECELFRLFEAARWAPSAFNAQPWRFLYALRASLDWDSFLDLINPLNRCWAANSSAIVFILSDRFRRDEQGRPLDENHSHGFDAGAAWAQLALQAVHDGLCTHGIGGFDHERAYTELSVPDGFKIEMAIAIGRMGDPSVVLPEALLAREMPSDRLPVSQIAFAGRYPAVTG